MPSPALMMADRQMRDSRWQAPDEECRSTIMSGDIASRLSAVSASVSPFTTLEVRDGDVQRVGAQALLGDLERGARARARLEEQVDHGLAAQRRHLLDRPRADLLHRLGGVEHERDLLGRQVGDAEQVLAPKRRDGRRVVDVSGRPCAHAAPPSCSTTSSRPSISCSRTCTLSSGDGRQVLADVVGLDRQLAMAAVDEHDQLNRLAAGRSRSARRAPRGSSARCTARRRRAGSCGRRWRRESRCGGPPAAGRPRGASDRRGRA